MKFLCIIMALFFVPTGTVSPEARIPEFHVKPKLTHEQKAWLGALEWCESQGNPKAVNPEDRDHTPSYGLLQFKPGTFYEFTEKYGIATTSQGYMDGNVQEEIVTQMILRGGVRWERLFPDCVRKLGKPPLRVSKESVK